MVVGFETTYFYSPSSLDPSAYVQGLCEANKSLQRKVARELEPIAGRCDKLAILTTGSDGRLEKGPYDHSKLEFILVVDDWANVGDLLYVARQLKELEPRYFSDTLEIKYLGKSWMSHYKGNPDKVFPTRLNDSVVLYGNPEVQQQAKRKMFAEFVGEYGKRNTSRFEKRKSVHAKIVRDNGAQQFKGEVISHYFQEGTSVIAIFDPQNFRQGFKVGPLRFVQYSLMLDTLRFYRALDEDRRTGMLETLLQAPQNISQRLFFLKGEGLLQLSDVEVGDLSHCYNFFVWAYNLSQERFTATGETTVPFDSTDALSRLRAITAIVQPGRNIFKPL